MAWERTLGFFCHISGRIEADEGQIYKAIRHWEEVIKFVPKTQDRKRRQRKVFIYFKTIHSNFSLQTNGETKTW